MKNKVKNIKIKLKMTIKVFYNSIFFLNLQNEQTILILILQNVLKLKIVF